MEPSVIAPVPFDVAVHNVVLLPVSRTNAFMVPASAFCPYILNLNGLPLYIYWWLPKRWRRESMPLLPAQLRFNPPLGGDSPGGATAAVTNDKLGEEGYKDVTGLPSTLYVG